MSTAPAVRRPSAVRRWAVRFLSVAAIGVLVIGSFVGWQVYRRFADQRVLQDTIADLDARHPRWRLEELEADRAIVPEEENSATVIRSTSARISPFVLVAPDPTEWSDPTPRPASPAAALTDVQLRSVVDLLESCESAIAPTLRLEHVPSGRHPITYSADGISSLLPHAGDISKIQARVLYPLVLLHLHEGDGEAAVRDCICTLHLARSLGDEPCVFSQTFRSNIAERAVEGIHRVLGQVTLSDADLARLQAKLSEEVARDGWPIYLRADRAAAHRMFAAIGRGDLKLSSIRRRSVIARQQMTLLEGAAEWLDDRYPPRINEAHAWVLAERTRLLEETASLPWHKRTPAVAAICADRARAPDLARLSTDPKLMLSSFQYHAAVIRCTLVAVAAERHRLRHGDWPASTAELVPGLLPELPLDPFGGHPLRYKRWPDGIVIYSVGTNGTDEGGQILLMPGQNQPWPNDIGVRLWDVAHRRQTPPAEEKQP
jgi:hypothetical protein